MQFDTKNFNLEILTKQTKPIRGERYNGASIALGGHNRSIFWNHWIK